MSKDTRVSIDQPTFTRGEVISITGMSAKEFDNWVQRGIVDFGQVRSGRWLFSIMGMIKLKIMRDAVTMTALKPSMAKAIADFAEERARELWMKGTPKTQEGVNFLLASVILEDDNFHCARAEAPKLASALRRSGRTTIVIPIDDITQTIVRACLDLLDASEGPSDE
jgi:hypothetical protein